MKTKTCVHCGEYVDDDHDEDVCRAAHLHPDRTCDACGKWVPMSMQIHRQHCGPALDPDQTRTAANRARANIRPAQKENQ